MAFAPHSIPLQPPPPPQPDTTGQGRDGGLSPSGTNTVMTFVKVPITSGGSVRVPAEGQGQAYYQPEMAGAG